MPGARTTVRGLAQACHPGPTVVVTVLAAMLVAGMGAPGSTVALVTAAVLSGQLSVGWSNDWIDAGRDRAVGRAGKPSVSGAVTPGLLRSAALAAALACVVLSFAVGLTPGAVHVVAVASAWSYNAWLKGTMWSWLPYAVSFALLPLFLVLSLPGHPRAAGWVLGTGALLGAGAHVANVLPDLEDDHATGVRGLPHRWGRRGSSLAAPALLVVAAFVAVLGPHEPPGALRWVLAAVAALLAVGAGGFAVVRPRSRLPFALSMGVAVVCVVLLVSAGRAAVAGA